MNRITIANDIHVTIQFVLTVPYEKNEQKQKQLCRS